MQKTEKMVNYTEQTQLADKKIKLDIADVNLEKTVKKENTPNEQIQNYFQNFDDSINNHQMRTTYVSSPFKLDNRKSMNLHILQCIE
jgi:hypothetical protein